MCVLIRIILENHSSAALDVEKLLEDDVVDLTFTDPPYNVDYEGTAGKIMNDKMEDNNFYLFLFKTINTTPPATASKTTAGTNMTNHKSEG